MNPLLHQATTLIHQWAMENAELFRQDAEICEAYLEASNALGRLKGRVASHWCTPAFVEAFNKAFCEVIALTREHGTASLRGVTPTARVKATRTGMKHKSKTKK
jgi:primosomal protein N''